MTRIYYQTSHFHGANIMPIQLKNPENLHKLVCNDEDRDPAYLLMVFLARFAVRVSTRRLNSGWASSQLLIMMRINTPRELFSRRMQFAA